MTEDKHTTEYEILRIWEDRDSSHCKWLIPGNDKYPTKEGHSEYPEMTLSFASSKALEGWQLVAVIPGKWGEFDWEFWMQRKIEAARDE